jgi:radical SAM/Cys-rich protein
MNTPTFGQILRRHGLELRRGPPRVLQLNLGKLCNQACIHCHVGAGPSRSEIMNEEIADRVIAWMALHRPPVVDLTGGAPELCPAFRRIASAARATGAHVIVRTNLTVFFEPGQGDLPEFFREQRLEVIASLPCYGPENVDFQRGEGAYDKSIRGLRRLNDVGYAREPGLELALVYNPVGPTLPPDQKTLEADYRRELRARHGIEFTRLLCLANLPVTRFMSFLERTGALNDYRQLLAESFNAATVDGLMCRYTINVGHEGDLFDCDFNQMVELPLGGGARRFLWDVAPADLEGGRIATGPHCFGCTAGHGSSCGGALA